MDNELRCVLKAKNSNIKIARNIAQIFFSQLDSSIGFLNEINSFQEKYKASNHPH